MAFFEILMSIMSIGNITGKPNIAIKVPPFAALDAIAEIMVKEEENPKPPKMTLRINKPMSSTGLPIIKLYTDSPIIDNTNMRTALNIIFEMMTACGLTKV